MSQAMLFVALVAICSVAVAVSVPEPEVSLEEFQKIGYSNRDEARAMVQASIDAAKADPSFVEVSTQVGVGKVRSYCEICILVVQMKERGQPHLCAGLNADYLITCVEVLESLLRADKALVYWLKEGCMHLDGTGPEIVKPCPAINICSWTPNLFATPPNIIRDGVESLCPKDDKFLPTIPKEYQDTVAAGGGAPAS